MASKPPADQASQDNDHVHFKRESTSPLSSPPSSPALIDPTFHPIVSVKQHIATFTVTPAISLDIATQATPSIEGGDTKPNLTTVDTLAHHLPQPLPSPSFSPLSIPEQRQQGPDVEPRGEGGMFALL